MTNPEIQLTVAVPDAAYEKMAQWLSTYEDVNVSAEDLKANPRVLDFIKADIVDFYFEMFDQGWENINLAEELGYEAEDED